MKDDDTDNDTVLTYFISILALLIQLIACFYLVATILK